MTAPMDRRALMGGALAAPLAGAAAAVGERRRPNVLFILADDLGYADLSCYGQRDFETPNLDRLAREGVRLTQGYSNSPVCSASRLALITGRYQYRLRAGLEEPIARSAKGSKTIGLPPSEPTLPSLFRDAGYGTTLIGKWHLGFPPHFGPLKSGYDHFFGVYAGAVDYFTHVDGPGGRGDGLYDDATPIERHGYLTDLLGQRACETIRAYAAGRTPFLLSLHYTAPHWPWESVADEAESMRLKTLFDWDNGGRETYAAMVRSLDASVGSVLAALSETGLSDDTIVVFASDNGGERFSDVWPFTGAKTELLEGGLRVPTLVRFPGRIPAGSQGDQVAISMDWLPTLLAGAGIEPPARPFDGENLWPELTGARFPHPRRLFWRYKANGQRALRDGDWKYLKIQGSEFLFDLARDPRERANLKGRHPEIFQALQADWVRWNATMLPLVRDSYSDAADGSRLADRYGARSPED